MFKWIDTYTHTHIWAYVQTHTYTHTYIYKMYTNTEKIKHIYMYTQAHMCTCTYAHKIICTQTLIYAHTHARTDIVMNKECSISVIDHMCVCVCVYIYIYIYIVIHRQTVLLYHNSSVWLEIWYTWSWDRNLLDLVSYHSANKWTASAREV